MTATQLQNWSSELLDDKKAYDLKQGEVDGQLLTPPSDMIVHGKARLVNQDQVEAGPGEVVPVPTKQGLQAFSKKVQLSDIKEQSQEPRRSDQMGKKLEDTGVRYPCSGCGKLFQAHKLADKTRSDPPGGKAVLMQRVQQEFQISVRAADTHSVPHRGEASPVSRMWEGLCAAYLPYCTYEDAYKRKAL